VDVRIDPVVLVGFSAALVRATAWVVVCPPFNSPSVPVRVRVGVAVSLAVLLARRVGESGIDTSTAGFVGALLSQAAAGLVMGLVVLFLFSALQAAGELIDLQVGFSLGGVIDPMSGNMAAPIGRFYQLIGIVVLFAIDGHVLVTRAFLRSVEQAPGGGIDVGLAADGLVDAVSALFVSAIEIALPVLAALFCAEVALGLLGKAAPQLNIMVVGFAVKTLIAFLLLAATLWLLPGATESLLVRGVRGGLRIVIGS
jgi:flagellar biosynthetic protein FliR